MPICVPSSALAFVIIKLFAHVKIIFHVKIVDKNEDNTCVATYTSHYNTVVFKATPTAVM